MPLTVIINANEAKEALSMEIHDAMIRMIGYPASTPHDAAHLLKVWGYARTIGEAEHIDTDMLYVLELAAIVHDISCPVLRKKYGSANGKMQEKESPELLRKFFLGTDISDEQLSRIIWLIAHHHSPEDIDGIDHQILIEADYLVNADESSYTEEAIARFSSQYFRTETGTALLHSIFG